MATALLNLLSYANDAVVVSLEYDDVTLGVSAIQADNASQDSCWIQIINSQQPAQQFTTTLGPGANRRQTLPAGAVTLQRVPGPPGVGTILSYAPWAIASRFPA